MIQGSSQMHWRHRTNSGADVAQDLHALIIVPVMEDPSQEVHGSRGRGLGHGTCTPQLAWKRHRNMHCAEQMLRGSRCC